MVNARRATTPPVEDAVHRFDVRVVGAFAVSCDGVPLEVDAGPRRRRSLLRFLATAPDHRHIRDVVIAALWPAASPGAGFGNLRTVLDRVRRAIDPRLPAPMFLAPGWIMLNPDCRWEIDFDCFWELVERAGDDLDLLAKAVALAAGEPLVEDRYEDWAVPMYERVWRRRRGICLHLARLHRVCGSREEAVARFERVPERDPLDEEAMQDLLGVLGEAVRRYHQFSRRLEQELDVSPAAETTARAGRTVPELVKGSGAVVYPQAAPTSAGADGSSAQSTAAGTEGLDDITSIFTHELAEACTDPGSDGLQIAPSDPDYWREIGDVCYGIDETVNGVRVQTNWSYQNRACVAPQKGPASGAPHWVSLGGRSDGGMVAINNQDGRLEILARNPHRGHCHLDQTQPNDGWSRTFESRGGQMTGRIAALSNTDGRIGVLARGTDSALGTRGISASVNGPQRPAADATCFRVHAYALLDFLNSIYTEGTK